MTTYNFAPVVIPPRRAATEVVAMIHVHTITSLLNTQYTTLIGLTPMGSGGASDIEVINQLVRVLDQECAKLNDTMPALAQMCEGGDIRRSLRSAPLLLIGAEKSEPLAAALDAFANLPFVDALVKRAEAESDIYVANGITHLEVENVGAPYFIGQGKCPVEEIVLEYLVLKSLRARHPSVALGMHILSSNELETLPVALKCGVGFIRSESTVFAGIRPEGQTTNCGNMARFMYVRNVLRTTIGMSANDAPVYPILWSDLQKKHTVFPTELHDLDVWLHNVTFMKLEGVIITGLETGSNVQEKDLAKARAAIDKVKAFNEDTFAAKEGAVHNVLPDLPVVTGSGTDFEMYCKYADFMIVGSALKQNGYWENPVDEANVKKVVDRVKAANEAAGRKF